MNKDIENLVLSINDIYEKNQNATVKMKHSEEELRCSIANMCHDLRTPLTSIMGYVQLIDENNLTKEQKYKYMDIIKKRTSRLQDLITNFYELSRVEAGDCKFDLKSINLKDILCEAIALFYDGFTKNGIEPNINIEENIPNTITDEKAVMRIFSNLMNNIIKHGEKNVIISLRKEKDCVVTEFENNAPGLKTKDINHLFDRTFTADSTRSNKNTGLGLSITKALVEQLGNKVEAELCEGVLKIRVCWNMMN
jgi:signal transduction histidine kinase